jgi:hypothetical protein
MLATQTMSSRGGQQNFPFGCRIHGFFPLDSGAFAYVYLIDQQENIHGMGLPEFMNPGPPPGQPLLNAIENQDLDTFFNDFEHNATAKQFTQFMPTGHDQYFGMPPTFVGSETELGSRSIIDPHQLQGGAFHYGDGMLGHDMNNLGQTNTMDNGMHGQAYGNSAFQTSLVSQLQTAATMQPNFVPAWQQQSFNQQSMMDAQQPIRQTVAFGTDARFQPNGYAAAPHNPMDPDLPHGMKMHPMDWFEPTSGSTTQPNTRPSTRPNTQPSSPNWHKKRTFDDFQVDLPAHNGFVASTKGQQNAVAQPTPPFHPRKRNSVAKNEKGKSSQPPTPLSNSKSHTPLKSEDDDHELDAEAEEEDEITEQARSPSPPPWPANKARPPRKAAPPPPPKPTRKKKASVNSTTTPIRPKARVPSTGSSASKLSSRVPLTLEQKKANHTNSEQRRRDATARAYAELYDLVPELEGMGKQSTMKKLEVVVAKVSRVKQRVEELRLKLGLDPSTGRPGTASMHSAGGNVLMQGDIHGWHQ